MLPAHESLEIDAQTQAPASPTNLAEVSVETIHPWVDPPPALPHRTIHPSKVIKWIHWWLRAEATECAIHFIFGTWFMFFSLRMPLSEIRERITGWLTLAVAISGSRCVILTMLLEEVKWLRAIESQFDIRASLVAVINSSKLSMSRWLHVLAIMWWCISRQLIGLYAHYAQVMKPLTNGQPILPAQFMLHRAGGRPLVTFNALEKECIDILNMVSHVVMGSLLVYGAVLVGYGVFFFMKATMTFSEWLHMFSPDNFGPLPLLQTGTMPAQLRVPPEILNSFPRLQWCEDWRIKSNEDVKHATTSGVCMVCLQSYCEGDQLRVLPCGHSFHVICIDEWLSTHVVCPVRCEVSLLDRFQGAFDESRLLRNLPLGAIEALKTPEAV